MGIVNKAKAAVGTAAVIAGSVSGQPSPTNQLAQHQNIRNQQRQTTSLSQGTRSKNQPTTSGRK